LQGVGRNGAVVRARVVDDEVGVLAARAVPTDRRVIGYEDRAEVLLTVSVKLLHGVGCGSVVSPDRARVGVI